MVTRGMDNNAEVSSSGPSSFIYFKCQVSFLTFVQYFAWRNNSIRRVTWLKQLWLLCLIIWTPSRQGFLLKPSSIWLSWQTNVLMFAINFSSYRLQTPCLWQESHQARRGEISRRVQPAVFLHASSRIPIRVGLEKRREATLRHWHKIQKDYVSIRDFGSEICCGGGHWELHMRVSKQCRVSGEWSSEGCYKRLVQELYWSRLSSPWGCSTEWNPYTQTRINKIEMVQHRAAMTTVPESRDSYN